MKIQLYFMLVSLIFTACKTPDLRLHPELKKSADVLEVKGRQGWMINQKISFGEYTSSKIERGWTFKYDIPFILRFQGASEKLSFTLYDAHNKRVEVNAIGKFKSTELPLINEYFGIPIDFKHYFAGSVYLPDEQEYVDFIVYNPNVNVRIMRTHGQLRGKNIAIDLVGITQLDQKRTLNIENIGYEFYDGQQALGAVQTFNAGKVWLHPELSRKQRLVLAAVSSCLLLRNQELDQPLEQP